MRLKNVDKVKKIKKHKWKLKTEAGFNILLIATIILSSSLMIFKFFIGDIGWVSGPSMEPTLTDSEVFISVNQEKYNRYDIVIATSIEDKKIIKRVIGTPGDTVEIKDNKVLVNDLVIEEFYVSPNSEMVDMPKVQLADNEYFVMGDNRNNSKDSRSYGKLFNTQIESKLISNFHLPVVSDIYDTLK